MSPALIAEDQLTPIKPHKSLHILSNIQRKSGKCDDVQRLRRMRAGVRAIFTALLIV